MGDSEKAGEAVTSIVNDGETVILSEETHPTGEDNATANDQNVQKLAESNLASSGDANENGVISPEESPGPQQLPDEPPNVDKPENTKEGDKAEETSNETEEEEKPEESPTPSGSSSSLPIVSSSKKSRPPYKYDPTKITLRFLFANKDGLTVTIECNPTDTVGEVKAALLSVWPKGTSRVVVKEGLSKRNFISVFSFMIFHTLGASADLPDCSGGDRLRLICMGKGMLQPDARTLEDLQMPVFKTHPTPVNVSVKPEATLVEPAKSGTDGNKRATSGGGSSEEGGREASQGCACVIL